MGDTDFSLLASIIIQVIYTEKQVIFLKAHRKMKAFWKDRKMYGIVEKERDRETAYL